MSAISRFRSWWKALMHRSMLDSEMEAELSQHIGNYAADLMNSGVPREEAFRRARLELGTIAMQKEECRSSLGLRPLDDFWADLRYGFRQLRRSPAFTVTVLVVLALGIGVNAAMFSIVDATLLRWLPFHKPSQLIKLSTMDQRGTPSWMFLADVQEWQSQTQTLAGLAYYVDDSAYLDAPGAKETISAPQVSANLFAVLGAQPLLGRSLLAEEQTPGHNDVAVLSEQVWRKMFAGDPQILGKQVKLNDISRTVVGIMPAKFAFPAENRSPQVWIPLELNGKQLKRDFSSNTVEAVGRLKDGIKPEQARAELSAIQQHLLSLYQGNKTLSKELAPTRVEAMNYRDTLVNHSRPALLALIAVVSIIWLIACANVANLMLARGMARQREIAVRTALGAGRGRIVRQLFTESLLLSICGAAFGLLLAQIALHVFETALSHKLKLPLDLSPTSSVLFVLLALSIMSAVLFGLLPALLAVRIPLEHSLRQSLIQAGGPRNRHRLQQGMVIAEIGLSLVLLVACGLLLRTVFELRKVPLGFRTDHVLLIEPKIPEYKTRGLDVNVAVYRPLLQRIQQMHGISSAALTTVMPLRNSFDSRISFYISNEQKSANQLAKQFQAKLMAAGPELQNVLGFKMYKGRFFDERDTPDSQPVAVVNRAFVNLYAKDDAFINKFKIRLNKDRIARIVGVMDDFHQAAIDQPSMPEIDFCATQLRAGDGFYQPTLQAHVELAIRTSSDPKMVIPDLRHVISEVNPDLEASVITTMDQVVEDSLGSQLLAAHLLEVFAVAALAVALSGLYGLLSYLVSQRTRELGVRIALGAQRTKILSMLLGQAGAMLVTGALAGIVMAFFASRLLANFLYGVKPHDSSTILAVTMLLIVCGLLAAYLPARKASRVDPMEALRRE